MYAWMHSTATEEQMQKYMHEELGESFNGVGFYLTLTDTMLVTVEDKHGERGVPQPKPEKDSRYNLYVFNLPFARTVFCKTCRTARDDR